MLKARIKWETYSEGSKKSWRLTVMDEKQKGFGKKASKL